MSQAAEIVGRLSLAQKTRLCMGADYWRTSPVPEAGIEQIMVSDGPHGLRKQEGEFLAPGLPATCFPTGSALGSCWDRALVREVGAALGAEAASAGVAVVLGPGVNIKRSPLCGRNYEYFSEDPYLTGRLAAALTEGVQSRQVGVCVKHFAANNQETDRLRVSADVDERTLREIYLPAFEHLVTAAHPWLVMSAYNKVNGVFAAQHRWLLTEVLRDEWGFDGVVLSDWGSVQDRVAALVAGLDLEMPPNPGISDKAIIDAVEGGTLDGAVLDRAAERVVRLVLRARARARARAGDRGTGPAAPDADAHHALARRAAAAGMVLLKNDAGVLPLAERPGLTVAVIGDFARTPRIQGAGSSEVTPLRTDVPLTELAGALPSATIRFARGYPLDRPGRDTGMAAELAAEALRVAAGADVVVVFLGLPPGAEVEGIDRTHIDLPAVQTDLVRQLARRSGPAPVVAVLFNGSVVRTSTWDGDVAAVLECWLGGQAAGGALADVLTGAVNPSGRLAETIPLRLEDTPSFLNFPGEEGHVRYGEGVFTGYRGYDASGLEVAYPFGHGLSYTQFGYRDLVVSEPADGAPGELTVRCVVTNTGSRAGHEVVQLYVGDPKSRVARPPRELKAFTRIYLEPGAAREVSFALTARDLSYWSSYRRAWTLEPGEFVIEVGASSRDIRLTQRVTVAAAVLSSRCR